jgi:class 3 adenylate cyclase
MVIAEIGQVRRQDVQPETSYVMTGGARVAYQRFGLSEPTILISQGSFNHTDVPWEDPAAALFFTRLGAISGVIRYDHLGTGNSDPFPSDWDASWRGHAGVLEAVLDACGCGQVVLLAVLDAGPVAIKLAAARPDLVSKLILFNSAARFVQGDGYPHGMSPERAQGLLDQFESSWGSAATDLIRLNVPSRASDPTFASWYAKFLRAVGTPRTMGEALRRALSLDAREDLARITQPTLIMHREGYQLIPIENAQYMADHIPQSRLVTLPGADGPLYWDGPDLVLAEIARFIEGSAAPSRGTRHLLTVVFTDMVRSTEHLGSMGDRDWNATLRVHNDIVQDEARRTSGRIVKFTGDGVLATFDDPEEALSFAQRVRTRLQPIGISIRAGVHTGEVNVTGDDVDGLAVNIASRVMTAGGDEGIFTSRTTHDLVLGSAFQFRSLGERSLKGIEGDWELFESV